MTQVRLIEDLFAELIELKSAAEREAYLDQVCGEDHELRCHLDKHLAANDKAGSFLRDGQSVEVTVDLEVDSRLVGATIGPYRLREVIGEGGMGTVYVAEQEKPLRRKVALKVIKAGMDSRAVIARFEAERNALALMNHPNIAKVLDAGTTEQGRPFFAMELVSGIPITDYCDEHKLSIDQRLELFVQVCQAIQHAHQKGIIHRDIKPTNVLVTELDGKAVPKVIDFGVAKALNQSLTDRSIYTSFQSVIGTPLYMSPEQASLSAVDVDTRSDVYSLGVLLYELLTGTTPLELSKLREAAQHEVLRIIREEEPPRPSNRISTLGETALRISQRRQTEPERLGRLVKGDLDWIVITALAKERSRRYESASRFAEDVQRHVRNEVVEARPPSTLYQLQKVYQRHKPLVTMAGIAVAALTFSCGLAVWSAVTFARQNEVLLLKNDQLEDAWKRWDASLEQQAIVAAFAGDTNEVTDLIKAARIIGRHPDWSDKVLGQLALHEGRGPDAINLLEEYLSVHTDDLGANSMLTQAYLVAGDSSRYVASREKLDRLSASGSFDRLLYAMAVIDGNNEQGLSIINEVIDEDPSPIAFAMRCHGRIKIDWQNYDEAVRQQALEDLKLAMAYMPNHPWIATLEFYAHFVPELRGELDEAERQAMLGAIKRLESFDSYPIGVHSRAVYLTHTRQLQQAHELWEQLHRDHVGTWMDIYYAASCFQNGDDDLALQILKEGSNSLNKLYLGQALAFLGREDEARGVYQDLRNTIVVRHRPDDIQGIPETILVLLGDQDAAAQDIEARVDESADWQQRRLDVMADPTVAASDVLAEFDGDNGERLWAHRFIAFRLLGAGRSDEAKPHLEACFDVGPISMEAAWARAFSDRIR